MLLLTDVENEMMKLCDFLNVIKLLSNEIKIWTHSLSIEAPSLESTNIASASSWGTQRLLLWANFSTMLIDCAILYSCIDTHTKTSIIQSVEWNHRDPCLKKGFSVLARLTLLFALGTTIVSAHSLSEVLLCLIVVYTIFFPH